MIDLNSVPSGTKVRKPNAIAFDYAFGREGIVIREQFGGHTHLGIQWEGSGSVFEYPEDTQVEITTEGKK